MRIDPDALGWFAAHIAGDRGKVRAALEKLITYKGLDDPTPICMVDVKAVCGAAGEQGFDDLVYAVASRRSAQALVAYNVLMEEGMAFVAIIRALQNHFRRLHMVKAYMQGGMDMEAAMKKLSPPVFFKQAPAFKGQVNGWSLGTLEMILGRLSDLEAQCKQTGMPVETLCGQAILGISKVRG
ncbi:MAG: DNA polymerase III subunit delta, partial [Alphaproteobacteria bacterium]